MDNAVIGALGGAIGIALGGGIQALQRRSARKLEASTVLSALIAEVEAINRLANHRGFAATLARLKEDAQQMIENGLADQPSAWLVIKIKYNYFSTYEALVSKIGLLHPYYADRITRFYTYVKAALENYDESSPHQKGMTAQGALLMLDNDLMLLHTVHVLGEHIASFRRVAPPKGVPDPFSNSALEPPKPDAEIGEAAPGG